MTLLIALILIDGFKMGVGWKIWAFIVWIIHLFYHGIGK